MSYLIDTDCVVDYLSGKPPAVRLVESLIPSTISISVITFLEVYEGVMFGRDPQHFEEALEQFMIAASVTEVDEEIARICAHVRGVLRREGRLIPLADLLIAATALRHDLILVTRNDRHFDRVPELRILSGSSR